MALFDKNAKVLLYGANIWYFGEGMFGPFFAVFAERVGGDILDITWAWAIYLIVMGSMNILVGKVVDSRKSNEEVMIVGYALNAFFTFGYLFVTTPSGLFLVQGGLGIAAPPPTPTW